MKIVRRAKVSNVDYPNCRVCGVPLYDDVVARAAGWCGCEAQIVKVRKVVKTPMRVKLWLDDPYGQPSMAAEVVA
jgi:hypothetical protein